ncbi:ACT domain-containing protein [Candidatus Woesearchaeota archaeon]|nr:ACT domain-containing protein [Candidatus Woesearchaeota archaeon]
MSNITKLTEQYISEHPSIKDSLKKGLINYSKLTRQIADDLDIDLKKNFDAILIACRRYYRKVRKEKVLEEDILALLRKSKVEVKNKIIAVVVEKIAYVEGLLEIEKEARKKGDIFHIIEGTSAITIIAAEEYSDKIKKLFKNKVIQTNEKLVEITLKSPKEIETTAGVVPYLYSLFGEHGINIVETLSCWTDTIFVIEEKDIAEVMKILRF